MRKALSFVALLLVLAGCGRNQPAAGVKVDPALATLVPADTVLLVGTRVEALLKTPVYQKYLASRQVPQIEEFARQTGLDPRKDLWELLFVSNGRQGILLGRGKFPDETDPRLQTQGATRFVYKGYNLIGNDRTAVLFISPSTAAVGETAALRSLVDQRQKLNGPPASLTALMKEIPAQSQFWAIYAGGAIDLGLPGNLGNVTKMLSSIQTGSAYFDLRTGLNGVATGRGSSEEGAQQVHDALKALVGLGRLSVPKGQPELAQAYDGIRVTLDSRRVKLYVDVPQELVDRFLGLWLGGRGNRQ